MKKTCITLLMFAMLSMMLATPVSSQLATDTARSWLAHAGGEATGAATAIAWPASADHHLWIVSFADGGFVILPGDDTATPILAWDTQSNAPVTNMHPGFEDLLDGYVSQLEAIDEAGLDNTHTRPQWDDINAQVFSGDINHMRDVAPLTTTSWDQDWPYNADCPTDAAGPGGHVYAGCGATTMAQIMKFWEHPAQGTGQHSYTHPDYGVISADFSSATYNWNSMPNSISSYDADIAQLLFHCGVAQDMDYGPDGSGAQSPEVVYAFPAFFDYDDGLQRVQMDNYSLSTWQQMMRTELDNGRPVFYAGYSATYGHAFVLDGYQGTTSFHFNFGWSGFYNGYYSLTNINPGSYNFSTDQEAIIGIQPDTGAGDGDPPTGLIAQVTNDDVHLHWNMPSGGDDELRWDSGQNSGNAIGLNGAGGTFQVAARFTPSELAPFDGMSLTQVEIYANDEAPLTLKVWHGGNWTGAHGSSGYQAWSQNLPNLTWEAFNTITLSTPVTIDASEELWIGYEVADPGEGVFPAGCDDGPSVNYYGNLIKSSNQWSSLVDLAAALDYNWNIGGYVTSSTGERIRLSHTPDEPPVCDNSDFAALGPNSGDLQTTSRLSRNLTGFKIYRDGVILAALDTPATRDYDDLNLADGPYEYYVTAMYDALESTPSNTVEVYVGDEYPAPTNLVCEATGGTVTLVWTSPSGGEASTEELIYDNDAANAAYVYPGNSMGVHMTPQEACQILTLRYFTSIGTDDHSFNAEVWTWSGSSPGTTLLHTQTAEALDSEWIDVDVRDAELMMDGDFMVAFGSVNSTTYLGCDNTLNNGRSWDYTTSSNFWSAWNEAYHVRAIVLYPDGTVTELRPTVDRTVSDLHNAPHVSKHGFDRGRFTEAANDTAIPLSRPAIDHFNIYRGGTLVGTTAANVNTFVEMNVPSGYQSYYVTAYYGDGVESGPSNVVTFEDAEENNIPEAVTGLLGNFPNPFNPTTTVSFSLAATAKVELVVYNLRGQQVATLVHDTLEAGKHEVVWQGLDSNGAPVASGVYFCRLKAGDKTDTRKMILLK